MLGIIFRGVFLVSILTWYSTSVWKMIDGYFRDQFRSYLEEEYRKNPRIKSDLHGRTVDKIVPTIITTLEETTTVMPQRELPEVNEDTGTVEVAENFSGIANEELAGGTSENETAWGFTEKNAFLGITTESGLESRKSSTNEKESRRSINQEDRDLEQQGNDDDHQSVSQMSEGSRKRIKYNKKSAIPRDISRVNQSPRRRNVKTITLTERDFKSVQKDPRVSNDDFWEFEEDADKKVPLEGILVSELPFKPRADIGDLDRVTADEYCPLTLEDEASCEETTKWP